MEWFREEAVKDTPALDGLCKDLIAGEMTKAQRLFQSFLVKTISIRDTGARKGQKENFYHGILRGLLCHKEDWIVELNTKSDDKCGEIVVEDREENTGIVI